MRIALACFSALAMTMTAQAASINLHRACSVQREPNPTSSPVCRVRAGTGVDAIQRSQTPGYYRVEIGSCIGYLSGSCFALPTTAPARPPASIREVSPSDRLSLGVIGVFDFSRATVEYEDTWSKGIGFGGGVQLLIPLNGWRISTAVSYAQLLIGRDLDGSGALENTSPTAFSQSMGYLSAQLLAGFKVEDAANLGDPVFWGEAGFEYLHPLGASQAIGDGASVDFTNTDKPLLALLGMSADFPLSSDMLLGTRLMFFYNLSATSGSSYFGARFSVAASLAL